MGSGQVSSRQVSGQPLARRRSIAMIGLVATLALMAAACSSDSTAPPSGPELQRQVPGIEFVEAADVIALGWVLDRSSPDARVEQRHFTALEAAVADVNTAGGLRGVPIELRGLSSDGDVALALDGLRRLESSGVQLVVIGCDAVIAPALAQRAAGLGMLSVSLCSGSAELGFAAGGRNFTVGLDDAVQGEILAAAVSEAGWVSVAMVSDLADPHATAQCDAAEQQLGDAEVEVRVRHELLGPGADVDAAVADLARFSSPDGFILCAGPIIVEQLAPQMRSQWFQPVLVTAAAEPALLDGLAPDLPDVSYLTSVETDAGGLAAGAAWLSVLDSTLPSTIDDPLALDLDDLAIAILGLSGLATDLGPVTFTTQGAREPLGLGFVTEGVRSALKWSPLSRRPLVAPSPPGTAPHPATVESIPTTVPTTVVPTTTS